MQDVILHAISKEWWNGSYRRSTPADEAKGIDGYVGEKAYSIKPDTHKCKNMLHDYIIFYVNLINKRNF